MRYFWVFFILSGVFVSGGLAAAETGQDAPPSSYYEDSAAQKAFAKQTYKFAKRTAETEAELKSLNPDWEIDSPWFSGDQNLLVYAAAMSGQTIYFVTADFRDLKVMSYDGHEVKTVIVYPLLPMENGPWGKKGLLEIRGDRIMIALRDKLFYGSLAARTLVPVDYLPPHFCGAFIHRDRIFMFSGAQLVSCDFDGGDWQVHFSATQEGKKIKGLSDKQYIGATAIGPGPDDDTLWLQSGSNLYQYSISANALTKILRFPEYLDNVHAFRCEDQKLYFGNNRGDCVRYDTVQKDFTFIGLKEPPRLFNTQAALPVRYFALKRDHNISGPSSFCLIGDWFLATGNDQRGYLNDTVDAYQYPSTVFRMSDYPHGPLLRFPGVVKWFPSPGGDGFVAVEFNRLTKIIYKPQFR